VSLSAPAATAVAAAYATASGSALSPSDYGSRSGRAVLEPGETSVTVTVPVAGDRRDEPNETFRLLLSNPDGASLDDRRGRATIVDDDPTPTDVSVEVAVGARIRARGNVTPAPSGGGRVTVTLLRKRDGTFVAVARKRPWLGRRGGYSTSFGLPSAGRCRVIVVVPRAPGRLGSEARRTFPCGGAAGG
jgi:Calx-beta domain-containing protein